MLSCMKRRKEALLVCRGFAVWVCILVGGFGLVGCVEEEACTAASCSSGLTITLENLTPDTPYTLTVTSDGGGTPVLCRVTQDATGTLQANSGECAINTAGAVFTSVAPVGGLTAIEVTLEAEGAEVARYAGEPWEDTFTVNGPECGPTCGNGAITLNAGPSS